MRGQQFSSEDNHEDDRLYHVSIDKGLDQLHQQLISKIGLVGLIVPSLNSTGRGIGQDELNRRLESGRLLLGHVLDNPRVLAVPASSSLLDSAGYPQVQRVWVVFALVACNDDQWLELKSAGQQLRRLWGVSVGLIGPYGFMEV